MSLSPGSHRWILLAHGSRLDAANQEVRELAVRLAEKLGSQVDPAFLEIATPSLPEALDQVLAENPEAISVLPYFLTQGRHLTEDIPRLIQDKARSHPEISIRLLEYIGSRGEMVDLLAKIVNSKNL